MMEYLHGWIGHFLSAVLGGIAVVASGLLKELTKDAYPWLKYKLVPHARPATLVERTYEPKGANAMRCSWMPDAKMSGAKANGYTTYLDPTMKRPVYRESGNSKEYLMVNPNEVSPLP
jgi:hypothetical protein